MSKDISIQEAYRVMQAASGIKVGDKVKVLRTAERGEMGWYDCCDCVKGQKNNVGHILTVTDITSCDGLVNWIELRDNGGPRCYFPFFALEVVESARIIRRVVTFIDETGKDVTDEISEETKRNTSKEKS